MEYSENKKKAIEMLDKYATEHVLFNIKQSDNLEENIEIVLNLIEKQQKALENSVSKEAIREKMKELEEEKEQLRIEKNVTWDSGIYKLDLKINILKEILGE